MWHVVIFLTFILAFWDGATTVMGVVDLLDNDHFGVFAGVGTAFLIFAIVYSSDRETLDKPGIGRVLWVAMVIALLVDLLTSFFGNIFVADITQTERTWMVYAFSGLLALGMALSPILLRNAIAKSRAGN